MQMLVVQQHYWPSWYTNLIRCPSRADSSDSRYYGYNYYLDCGVGYPSKLSQVRSPSKLVVLTEGYQLYWKYLSYYEDTGSAYAARKRHSGGANYLCADWHVGWVKDMAAADAKGELTTNKYE